MFIHNKNDLKCRKRKQSRARIALIYDEWRFLLYCYYHYIKYILKTEGFTFIEAAD